VTGGIGVADRFDVRVLVTQRHRDTREDALARVNDRALDPRALVLRMGWPRRQRQARDEAESQRELLHGFSSQFVKSLVRASASFRSASAAIVAAQRWSSGKSRTLDERT
jgi:hypothetical protein